jgi:2-dehydropantoate 2-reductase
VIIGAGAVGGSIGAQLHLAGHDVVLVARGAHLAALQRDGLRYASPRGSWTLPIPAVDGPDSVDLDEQDVLLVAVKLQHAAAVFSVWSRPPVRGGSSAGPAIAATRLPVFCVQNGVAGERMALRYFDRVYGVTVMLPAGHLEPGVVVNNGAPVAGILTLGRYPHGLDDTARAVADDLGSAGFTARLDENVMRWKYNKLLNNLGNAVQVVLGPDGAGFTDVMERAEAEALAALRSAGVDFASEEEEAATRAGFAFTEVPGHPRRGGSSWQSVARGTGSVEVAYLSGEIALLGRLHDVPTPVNATVTRLADECAVGLRETGSLSAAEVLALADA